MEILFTYRPPNNNNLKLFFEETTQSANKLPSKCDNFIIAGEFNIDTGSKSCRKFKQFTDFDLTILINFKTCFVSATSLFSLDIILTNTPRSFQKTAAITTGLNGYHKMITTSLTSSHARITSKYHLYKNYKNFKPQNFLIDLKTNLRLEKQASTRVFYDKLTKILKETTDKHASQKKRKIRSNQAPFTTKELSKQIVKRSKSKYFK